MDQEGRGEKKKKPGLIYEAFRCLDGSLHPRSGTAARSALPDLLYAAVARSFVKCQVPRRYCSTPLPVVTGLIYSGRNFRTRHNSYYSLLRRGNKRAIDIWKNEKYVQKTLGPEAKKEKRKCLGAAGGWGGGRKGGKSWRGKRGGLTSSCTLSWPVSETRRLECLQTNESAAGLRAPPDTWSPHMTSAATCGSRAGWEASGRAVGSVGPGAGWRACGRGLSCSPIPDASWKMHPGEGVRDGAARPSLAGATGCRGARRASLVGRVVAERHRRTPVSGIWKGGRVLCWGRLCVCPCAVCHLVPGSLRGFCRGREGAGQLTTQGCLHWPWASVH